LKKLDNKNVGFENKGQKKQKLIMPGDKLINEFRSTEIGQVHLDKNLIIKNFTPAVQSQINITESDIGRSFVKLSNNIQYADLAEDIKSVIKGSESIRREVSTPAGSLYLMKIIPHLKSDKSIDGAIVSFVDITYLKSIENLLSNVINSSSHAILYLKAIRNRNGEIFDFKGQLANKNSKSFIGISDNKFQDKYLIEDNIRSLQFLNEFIDVVENNQDFKYEYFYAPTKKWFDMHAVKLDDGIVISLADISERKKLIEERDSHLKELTIAKEKLFELNKKLEKRIKTRTEELMLSEDRFKLLSKATNDAVWDHNLITDKIWWNDGYTTLFGYSSQSSGVNSWYDLIHPGDFHLVVSGIKKAAELKEDQWQDEFRFLKADGTYAFVLGRAYILYNSASEAIRMVGSMIDMTGMKKAQQEIVQSAEKTKFIAESMPGKVWTADEEGRFTYINARWLEYSGLSFKEMANWGWQNIIHRDDLFETQRLWKQSIATGQDLQIEHRLLRADGIYHWHLTRGIAWKDNFGKIVSWIGTTTDIHEKAVMEERKDEFIGVASHELKTPLTSLKAYTQLLEMTIEAGNLEDSKIYIKKTNTFIDRLNTLISDLLNVSKIQAGKLEYNHTCFSFDELAFECAESVRQIHKNYQIKIKGMSGAIINADRSRLEQVFVNYLTNAIKYSPKSNKIEMLLESGKDGIKAGVRDFGIGIAPEKVAHIFKRFYRVEGMAHQFQGLGLGLYISSQIVERFGGKCWVESTEDKGSTFWFSLPPNVVVEQL
jgi:two-component system, chemotaxis family, CheB/CheR fusion protein